MANLSDIELNKVCRTCLLNSENMKSLFEISSTSVQISFAEMLMKSTQLTYFKNDGFPAQICHNCIAQLNTSYTFQLKCLNSETIIRKKTETNILTTPKSEATATSVNPNVNVTIKMEPARDPMNDCFNNIEQIYVPGKPLNTLLSITEMQTDLSQELDEIKLDVNTETSDSKEEMNKSSDIPSQSTESDNKISHARRKTFYSCRICDKSYCSKQNLTIHLRKHTGEKPYMCTICNSSFNKNEHLMRHIRSHTGEKPFLCTVCSSGFNRKDNLFIHMRKHSGEKPYTCTVCNYRFSTKTSLTTHMRKHSVPKSNLCTGCNIRLE